MSDEQNSATPDVTQNDSNTASVNTATNTPQTDTTDWKGKYNGLNGHALKLTEQKNVLVLELRRLTEEREAEKLTLSSELETFKKKATEYETAAQQAARERDEIKARHDTGASIRKEFPSLAGMYDEGLMPGVEAMAAEARAEYLTKLNARFGQVHETSVKKGVEGTTPDAPNPGRNGDASDTPATAMAKVDAYLRSGGKVTSPEYAKMQAAYIQAIQNSTQIK